jgi:hypothetical protein
MSIKPSSKSDELKPWGSVEKESWWQRQTFQRSYANDILSRINALPADEFKVEQYGALSTDPARYPLMRVMSKNWNENNPTVLITGGVHGYEPSGITGALRFIEEEASKYTDKVNFVVYPCVSPLGYEINHRWNRRAEDPNRHFFPGGTAEEAIQLMKSVDSLRMHFKAAVDLHETNDRDKELTLERRARDGEVPQPDDTYIPEGFYLVVADKADAALGQEVIDAVRKITPICADPTILGYPSNDGVIVIDDVKTLCQDFARKYADVAMTTEIYPEKCSRRESEDAQIATIKTAVAYALRP